jgi:phytoene synthase
MKTYTDKDFEQDVLIAKELQKKHGTSYFFATTFFPKDIRNAIFTLYGFFRISDEIVDSAKGVKNEEIKKQLLDWKNEWTNCYNGARSENPVLRAAAYVFHTYHIPFELSISFLDAMMQDTEKATYANYNELETYMYGSASCIGIMISYVVGFKDQKTLLYAKKLGEAMQLTNFLRDIGEDFTHRGRIYMPQDELAKFGITDEISAAKVSDAWKKFMKFQITRARTLYREAEPGISELDIRGQLAVRLASRLYERILTKIEDADYNTFTRRVRTKLPEKLRISVPVMIHHFYNS